MAGGNPKMPAAAGTSPRAATASSKAPMKKDQVLVARDSDDSNDEEEEEEEEEDVEDEAEPLELNIDNFGRPHGVVGTMDYSFRSLPGALRVADDRSYEELVADCETAFTAREIENAEYSTGTTFFLPSTMAPRCVLERLAKEVFDFHTRDVEEFDVATSGAEWWTLVLDAGAETNDDVSFHWDRDYGLEDQYRVNLHPHVGTVTYLSTVGGPTVVLDRVSPVQTGSDDCGAGPIARGFLSRPAMGKHISFDGRLLHGAPGDLATVFHDAQQAAGPSVGGKRQRDACPSSGKRVTFLVNVWLNHKPIESDPFPEADLAKFVTSDKTNVRFVLDDGESSSAAADAGVRTIVMDESKAPSVTTLELSFIEASRRMALTLPVPVGALQAAVRDDPALSSFELVFPTTEGRGARLVAGEEVEEEEDDDDEEEEGEEGEEED